MAGGGGSIAGLLAIRICQVAWVKIRKEDRISDTLMPLRLMLDLARIFELTKVYDARQKALKSSAYLSNKHHKKPLGNQEHETISNLSVP